MWAVLVLVVIVAVVLIVWQGPEAQAPEIGTDDTNAAINAQIESIDLGDLESELQDIDTELDQL